MKTPRHCAGVALGEIAADVGRCGPGEDKDSDSDSDNRRKGGAPGGYSRWSPGEVASDRGPDTVNLGGRGQKGGSGKIF